MPYYKGFSQAGRQISTVDLGKRSGEKMAQLLVLAASAELQVMPALGLLSHRLTHQRQT
jgi:hypothetical protein